MPHSRTSLSSVKKGGPNWKCRASIERRGRPGLQAEDYMAIAYCVALDLVEMPLPASPRHPEEFSTKFAACEAGMAGNAALHALSLTLPRWHSSLGVQQRPLDRGLTKLTRAVMKWAMEKRAAREQNPL